MSISLNKLNKPGMNTSFGTNKTGKTSVTAQATKNMASGNVGNTSLFRLSAKHTTGWTPGQQVTPNISKHNYQGVRQSLNARGFTPTSNIGYSGIGATQSYQATSSLNAFGKGQVVGQILNGTFGMLNQLGVFDKLKTSASSGLDEAAGLTGGSTPDLSGVTSDVSSVISQMSSCNDSSALRSSLTSARGQYNAMKGQTAGLKSACDTARSNVDKLSTAKNKASEVLQNAEGVTSKAKQGVTSAKQGRDKAFAELKTGNTQYDNAVMDWQNAKDNHTQTTVQYDNAKAAHTRATEAKNQAETSFNSAEAAYNSAPDTLPDGSPNPQKSILKTKMEQAKQVLENAKTQEAKAEEDEKKAAEADKKAAEAEDKALQTKTDLYNNLGQLKEKADAMENGLKDAQGKVDDAIKGQGEAEKREQIAQENYDKASQQLEASDGAIEKYTQHINNLGALEKAIQTQEKRLTELEKKEEKALNNVQKDIAKNDQKIGKLDSQIDASDGVSKGERKKANKMNELNNENKTNRTKEAELSPLQQETKFVKEFLNGKQGHVDGNGYNKADYNGKTFYAKDGVLITEEEYNAGTGNS